LDSKNLCSSKRGEAGCLDISSSLTANGARYSYLILKVVFSSLSAMLHVFNYLTSLWTFCTFLNIKIITIYDFKKLGCTWIHWLRKAAQFYGRITLFV